MSQASPSYTPPEILQAGYKAEMDGRIDYAVQFYRHLTDYYAQTPEGAEARQALQRINSAESASQSSSRPLSVALNSSRPADSRAQAKPAAHAVAEVAHNGHPHQAASHGRSVHLPARAGGFWIGRSLAVMLMISAVALIIVGGALLAYGFVFGFDRPAPGGFTTIVAGPSLLGGGIALLMVSQLCLALFRIAIAATDLAAVTRASAGLGHDEG